MCTKLGLVRSLGHIDEHREGGRGAPKYTFAFVLNIDVRGGIAKYVRKAPLRPGPTPMYAQCQVRMCTF